MVNEMVIGKPKLGKRIKITIMEYDDKIYQRGMGVTIYNYTLEKAIENIVKGFPGEPKGKYDFKTDGIEIRQAGKVVGKVKG